MNEELENMIFGIRKDIGRIADAVEAFREATIDPHVGDKRKGVKLLLDPEALMAIVSRFFAETVRVINEAATAAEKSAKRRPDKPTISNS